jgi:SAM-dependent methyltransferase
MPSLDDLLEEAAQRPLAGWDVSYGGRIVSTKPWDFEAVVDTWIARSPDLLDMGTGGGEWLSRRPFPAGRTVATEGWPPNVPLAQARLSPRGATVIAVEGAPDNADPAGAAELPALPFADGAFQLITNRHEAFVAAEVARVLAPGGRFLTQQVGPDLAAPFRLLLGDPPVPPPEPAWRLAMAVDQVHAAGLEVTSLGEGAADLSFADVGALAWYLLNVPWVLPDFSVARHRAALGALYARGPITAAQPMFWLAARKSMA